jgi:Domain of unknown function (DUF4136)
MKLQKAFALGGFVLFLGNVCFAQQVKTDYDRSANLSKYRRYCWEKVQTPNPLWVDRIKDAVNSALQSKGWTPAQSGCDVAIVANEINHNQETLNTYYDNFGGGWRWRGLGGFGESTTSVDTYKVGSLVIDLFDANTKNLVWRGSATDMLSDKSEKNIQNLDKGVRKMFQHFPPEPKK